MELTLDALKSAGGFAGGLVKKKVEWHHEGEPVTFDVWIRPMSYHTAVGDIAAVKSNGDIIAHRLAASVCHEDGSPVFLVSDITGINADGTPIMTKDADGKPVERGPLNRELADALMVLVSEVSGLGKRKPSAS